MAVPVEKIKARLKALFPKANLSTKRLDALAAKLATKPADDADDTAIDVVLNTANDFMSFEDIAKEDDRVRTLEAKLVTPADPIKVDPPTPTPTDPIKTTEEVPSWAKGLVEANTKLLQEVEAIKTGRVLENKKQSAASVFEASEVLKAMKPEIKQRWLNRINVESETPVEDQLKELETEYTELYQSTVDSNKFAGSPPSGKADTAPSAAEVTDILTGML